MTNKHDGVCRMWAVNEAYFTFDMAHTNTAFVGTCVEGVVIDKAAIVEAEDVAVGRPCEWNMNVGRIWRAVSRSRLLGVRGATCLR